MTWAHCLVYLSLSFVSCFMGGGQEYPLLGLARELTSSHVKYPAQHIPGAY